MAQWSTEYHEIARNASEDGGEPGFGSQDKYQTVLHSMVPTIVVRAIKSKTWVEDMMCRKDPLMMAKLLCHRIFVLCRGKLDSGTRRTGLRTAVTKDFNKRAPGPNSTKEKALEKDTTCRKTKNAA